jgi:adenylate cyclase
VKKTSVIFLLSFVAALKADEFADKFAIVMIDEATEVELGPFPYDRAVMAKAVDACAADGAKAVVFKFFFDQPKTAAGDSALCHSMHGIPVALQARLDADDGTEQQIPSRFELSPRGLSTAVRGERGWIPLPAMLDVAAAVGFVDFNDPRIPLVEEFRGIPYRSLILCCLELAVGAPVRVDDGKKIEVGNGYIPVDTDNVYHADLTHLESLRVISFASLLAGNVERRAIEGRVVIIGLDSAPIPSIVTEHGRMGIHRFFVQCLAACYQALRANQSPEPQPAAGTPPEGQEAPHT